MSEKEYCSRSDCRESSAGLELSVVIPIYNSAATLDRLFERLSKTLEGMRIQYEIIFVDDGSADESWSLLTDLQKQHPSLVTAVELMRNYGQHNALMCGFRRAKGKYIVTLDDDLQNPPEEIPKLLAEMQEGSWDLVYGSYQEKQHSSFRNFGSWLVSAFYRLVFRNQATITSFRCIRRELVESIFVYAMNFTFVDGLLAWNTERIGQVEVEHHSRRDGRSGYSPTKLLVLALNLFTNFSLLPLQAVSLCGLVAALGGIAMGAYYLLQYLFSNIEVQGYASTIIAILVLGGLQLMSLGIIGEYLGRLHLNINRKPQYTERRTLPSRPSKETKEPPNPAK